MNLKISDDGFRFKLTAVELENLLQGRDVEQRVPVGHHWFSYKITAHGDGADVCLEMAVGGFSLFVPRAVLAQLQAAGRSREGLSFAQNGIRIDLQVDIRDVRRKAA